jgi:carboxymethylenebutenolidase
MNDMVGFMSKMIQLENCEAYEVLPVGECKGGLIVIHEVWGLTRHIKDMAERYAAQGYHVIAPDLLQQTDISNHATDQMQKDLFDPKKRNDVQPKLREFMAPLQSPEFAAETMQRLQACFYYVYEKPEVHQKVASLGYCFGGSYSFNLAAREPRLIAAVPYYGHSDQTADELESVNCPILAFYGADDERLMKALPTVEKNMQTAGVDFTKHVYAGAGHAFNNDTNPFAYNKTAATDAWDRSIEFLHNVFGA